MEVTFWGVRGSHPVPGPNTVRYGGQTSCVEVRSKAGCLIIDAGTGLRALGQKLAREQAELTEQGDPAAGQYHFILSHVHWDHIQGLPFFEPAYIPGTKISMYALRAAADELQQVIGGITRHEFFPMPLELVPAKFEFHEVEPSNTLEIFDFEVLPIALNHPFGAVGYRINADDSSLAYVCDTAPFHEVLHKQHFLDGPEALTLDDREILARMEQGLRDAIADTHSVIYDTHFFPEEYERFPHWGHSTPEHAIDICKDIGVKRLILYHHAPAHTDDMMDESAARYRKLGLEVGLDVVTAVERQTLPIGVSRRGVTNPGVGV